jgi:hypothetical protein
MDHTGCHQLRVSLLQHNVVTSSNPASARRALLLLLRDWTRGNDDGGAMPHPDELPAEHGVAVQAEI